MTLRYLDVCAGISAASVAWQSRCGAPIDWQCAGYSEIDPFPRAVLEQRHGAVAVDWDHRHMPQSNVTPLFGDFTQIEAHHVGPIDLLVGGTPCQSFSVAGKRLGLDDPRGNLAIEFLALARRIGARWLVWENVPGVYSSRSDDGDGVESRDFLTFINLFRECGYRGGWRTLDAQYVRVAGFEHAVPQRRRRVFLVGYLGDAARATSVLFDRESLCGHPAPRREAGQGVAPTISARTQGGGGLGTDFDCDGGLIAGTVSSKWAKGTGGPAGDECQNLVTHQTAATLTRGGESHNKGGYGGRRQEDDVNLVAHALRADGFDVSEDGTGRGTPLAPVCYDTTHITSPGNWSHPKPGDPCHPVTATAHVPLLTMPVAFAIQERAGAENERSGSQGKGWQEGIGFTLEARHHVQSVATGWAVRRLTPRECERLQGFPALENCYIIRVCRDYSDQQKANAHAALLCRKSQNNALTAAGSVSKQFANAADNLSNTLLHGLASRAVVSVQIDLERGEARLVSPAKSHLSAEDADERSLFPLPTGIASIAHLAVLLTRAWESATQAGKAASQANTQPSTPAWIGSGIALLSGREIAERASGAEKSLGIAETLSTSTTLGAGLTSQNFALTLETLCCCVAHVIAGFIAPTTLEASSYDIALTTSCGFTAVPYRGKAAADGPRYKALGNSMAVNAMRWIGQRIDWVERITNEVAA